LGQIKNLRRIRRDPMIPGQNFTVDQPQAALPPVLHNARVKIK